MNAVLQTAFLSHVMGRVLGWVPEQTGTKAETCVQRFKGTEGSKTGQRGKLDFSVIFDTGLDSAHGELWNRDSPPD